MTELQNSFEIYGIDIQHIFLFGYLTREISHMDDLKETLDDLLEELDSEIHGQIYRGFFDDELWGYVKDEDPDLAAYLWERNGILIKGWCQYPDRDHITFDADGNVKGWMNSGLQRSIYAYAQTLDEALEMLVAGARRIEESIIELARQDRNKGGE